MSLNYLYEKSGEVSFPSFDTDVENEQLFSVYDPVRDRLIGLFEAAINQEMGHSLVTVASDSPWYVARQGTNLVASMPVADTFFMSPTPDKIKEANLVFPLLALYRTSAVHEEFSLAREAERCTWGLDYILPPLSASELRRLSAVLSGVRKLIPLVIRRQGHPAYDNGAIQFGVDKGTLSSIAVKTSQEGPAVFSDADNSVYYALHFELETVELDSSAVVVETEFAGVDVVLAVGGDTGVLPDVIEANTDFVPEPNDGVPLP